MSHPQQTGFCKQDRNRSLRKRVQHLAGGVALATAMALLASPAKRPDQSQTQTELRPLQSVNGVQITMSSTLSPPFNPAISDYVVTYNPNAPIQVSVNAPKFVKVSVDSQPFNKLVFTTNVNVTPGQSFTFVINSIEGSNTYHVRCLPADFPQWTTERPGIPQAEYYFFTPNISFTNPVPGHYAIISDNHGVPLWWYRSTDSPIDAKIFPNGNVAWIALPVGEERKLDGTLTHTFTANAIDGGKLDNHELLMLPNGDYLYIVNVNRGPVDLSAYGGSATATVLDNVITEYAPDGTLVWSWSAMDHVSLSETGTQWWNPYLTASSPADPYHMNSVEPDGDGYVVSLRHLNAVIRIDKASGNIVWKLGGTSRPESLAFVGDTHGNFSGQHDARILSDGTLALHDNGTTLGRGPRGVRYTINTVAKTATLVEQVTDADVSASACCGSARKLSTGDWVASWGGAPNFTELAPDGTRVFRVKYSDTAYFSYRAFPVLPGVVSRDALRSGMDAQFPR